MLKVTHMLTLAGSAAVAPEPQPLMGTFTSQVGRRLGGLAGQCGGWSRRYPRSMLNLGERD